MKAAKYTLTQFREQFPDDDACLDFLFKKKYAALQGCPNCAVVTEFKRVKSRRSYQCPECSHQIYPTAGTIFHQSTTPLTYWFMAVFLFTTTRTGVSAKEIERTFDISYTTALRMAHKIKEAMGKAHYPIFDELSIVDETYVGGLAGNRHLKVRKVKKMFRNQETKTAIVGIIDPSGKNVLTRILPEADVNKENVQPIMDMYIPKKVTLVTDAAAMYLSIGKSYENHVIINHQKEFVKDGYSSNRIENLWSRFKAMMSTHVHISERYMHLYADENTFRYVNRHQPEKMVHLVLQSV